MFWGSFPQPPGGSLSPLVPLSPRIGVRGRLRACKGEGERRTEAQVRAEHAPGPLVQYWGEGDGARWLARDGVSWGRGAADPSRGIGMGGGRGGEWRGGLGDLHIPSPDSSLPFGMTVRGGGGGWREVGVGGAWAAHRSYFEGLSMSGTAPRGRRSPSPWPSPIEGEGTEDPTAPAGWITAWGAR